MKNFRDYLKESEEAANTPVTGDVFAVNIREECLVESVVLEHAEDGIVIAADDRMLKIFESYGISLEDVCMECGVSEGDCGCDHEEYADDSPAADPGEYSEEGDMAKNELATIVRAARRLTGMLDNDDDMPEWTQKKINKAADYVDTAADYIASQKERGIMEQPEDGSPVSRAVLHRIMMTHPGLIATYGPEKVIDAVDELAYHVGDVDEIGTSDVSGWVREVITMLAELPDEPMNVGDALDEGEIDDTWMNDRHREFYKRNPHFKRNDRERVEVGHGTQLATRVKPAVKPAQVQKKPATRFGIAEGAGIHDILSQYPREVEQFQQGGDLDANLESALWDYYYNRGDIRNYDADASEYIAQQLADELGLTEAEYRGRDVPLGKPMRGDVKKFKVFVKDPKTGNVKKVNFGDPNMRIKKSNPARRKSFRARHNCDNPGPRTKARYWSCRKW